MLIICSFFALQENDSLADTLYESVFDALCDGTLVSPRRAHACGVRSGLFVCCRLMREAHEPTTDIPGDASGGAASTHLSRKPMP